MLLFVICPCHEKKKGVIEMYGVLDISKYVIYYSNEHNYGITNIRLQRILYFVQLYFLKIRGTACFEEKMIAWDCGPVSPKVFHTYLKFGAGQIPDYRNPNVSFNNKIDCQIVEGVVDLLSHYGSGELTDMVLCHPVYTRARGGEITVESMKEWIAERENEK